MTPALFYVDLAVYLQISVEIRKRAEDIANDSVGAKQIYRFDTSRDWR